MENKQSGVQGISSTEALFVGALAPGVNGPTWNTLKMVFVMLGVCLISMLALAFTSRDSALVLHIGFLVLITVTLFLLLCGFLEQTGLVSVEQQMQDIGLTPNDTKASTKTE